MKQKHFMFLLWKRLFVMPFLLMAMSLSAQHFFEYGMSIDSAVVITATANSYKIEFTLEMDSLQEVFHYENAGNFSTLELPKPYMYSYLDSIGRPMLPHRKIYLQVPENFDDYIYLTDVEFEYEYFDIKYPYYPFQMLDSANLIPFVVNETAYLNAPNWTNDNRIDISPYIDFFDEKGFCVDIYPYSYNPLTQRIRVIKRMRANIPINFPNNPNVLTMCCGLNNYLDIIHSNEYHYSPGNILIVTPKNFVNTQSLTDYIARRVAQGHSVTTLILEDIADQRNISISELTASVIKSEIQSVYMNSSKKYLILIGNKEVIPYASGIYQDGNNPESDFDYAIKYMPSDSSRISIKMIVGRWPVGWEDTTALRNIINNIVDFEELTAAITDRANLPVNIVSGNGNNQDKIYEGALACTQLLQPFNEKLYDGRTYSNCALFSTIKSNIDNGLWSLVYRGHGSQSGMASPLCIYNYLLPIIYAKIPPMVFSFACCTNSGSFGSLWVRNRPNSYGGASAFFGSTTVSYTYQNNEYSAALFGNFKFAHLGDAIAAGSQKFYTKNKINDMKRYVFLGDPAMHVFGESLDQHNCYAPKSDSHEENNYIKWEEEKISIIKSDTTDKQVYVYTADGRLMLKTRTFDGNTYDTTQWPSGVYLIIISDGINVSSQKYLKK